MNTYIIEGGIGKQVAFTAIIDALVKKDKEKIQVHSPYVDIFGGNTNVKYALDANTILHSDKEEEHGPSGWKPSYTEENKTISLAYDDFIAPLIKSVQELSAEVTELKAQLKTT